MIKLFHTEEFVRHHPDFEGTVERLHVARSRELVQMPEPRRSHVEERIEAEPAEVIERVR